MNNTKSSMIGMKLKDAIKLDILRLDKTYPEDNMPLKLVCIDIYISLENNVETKKDKLQTLSRIKIHTGQTNS